MKKLYIFIFLIVIPTVFYAQNEQWSDPVPISDSLTDNMNITLSTMQGMYSMGDTLYACWEKVIDAQTTALYWRTLIPFGDPQVLITQSNVQFSSPRIYKYNTGDTAFGVYFHANMNGNWDIYYVCYLRNGTVSPMIPVRTTAQDETSLHYDLYQGNIPEMVWEQDGRILYQRANSDTIQIDKNVCHNPLICHDHIFWTKYAGGSESIYFSTRNTTNGVWGAPVLVYGGEPFQNLSIGNDTHGDMSSGDLVWDRMVGSKWRLMDFDPFNLTQYSFPDFSTANNITPSYLTVYLVTDSPGYLDNAFKTFASDTTGNFEIWVSSFPWGNGYINISNYGDVDVHPQLFNFFQGGDNRLFDIWESWHNGHWQLWMTNMDILSGINQDPKPGKGYLAVHPNPFREETTIEFLNSQPDAGPLTICNALGKKVVTLDPNSSGTGKVTYTWNGKNENGLKMPSGMYFCTIKTGNHSVQQKIVIL
jgi:hypothetical protein